jgi:RimJ/RimL family protein N-acetyltransferase
VSIELVSIYDLRRKGGILNFLYDLLKNRDPIANISHRAMPTFEQHEQFVDSKPYECWYVIFLAQDGHAEDGHLIGAIYLTKNGEIGISIARHFQGRGYGKTAIRCLMSLHPRKEYLANIAPGNSKSLALFEGMGFHLVQYTLRKDCP